MTPTAWVTIGVTIFIQVIGAMGVISALRQKSKDEEDRVNRMEEAIRDHEGKVDERYSKLWREFDGLRRDVSDACGRIIAMETRITALCSVSDERHRDLCVDIEELKGDNKRQGREIHDLNTRQGRIEERISARFPQGGD